LDNSSIGKRLAVIASNAKRIGFIAVDKHTRLGLCFIVVTRRRSSPLVQKADATFSTAE
jgi:hypothetical protein